MSTNRDRMYARIEAHGRDLIALLGLPTTTDPVALCKALRRIEAKASSASENLCNVPGYQDKAESEYAQLRRKLRGLLGEYGESRVIINRDPRGYALKVELRAGENLHRDMGGYGIIAPDLR